MNIHKIKRLLDENRETILSYSTKSERLDCINSLFQQSFPQVSLSDALTGPITNMTAFTDHFDSHKLIGYISQLKDISGQATIISFPGSYDYKEILIYIQDLISSDNESDS